MIGRIAGLLVEKAPPQVLIDCGGVGYELDVPMSTLYNLPSVGERVTLFAHLVVREDAQLLYGFGSQAERASFRELIKISGVGPRIALAVLSGLSIADLAQAVTLQDAARLVQIPGIGKKTAERLLLELKGKLGADLAVPAGLSTMDAGDAGPDILKALQALGYSDKEALFAIKQVAANSSVSDGIRQALKVLSKA